MRLFNGPLGPLSIAMAAALFVLAGSTPADAQGPDDDDRPAAQPSGAPVQRAAPLARYTAPTPSNGFTTLVADAVAFAHHLTGADPVAAGAGTDHAALRPDEPPGGAGACRRRRALRALSRRPRHRRRDVLAGRRGRAGHRHLRRLSHGRRRGRLHRARRRVRHRIRPSRQLRRATECRGWRHRLRRAGHRPRGHDRQHNWTAPALRGLARRSACRPAHFDVALAAARSRPIPATVDSPSSGRLMRTLAGRWVAAAVLGRALVCAVVSRPAAAGGPDDVPDGWTPPPTSRPTPTPSPTPSGSAMPKSASPSPARLATPSPSPSPSASPSGSPSRSASPSLSPAPSAEPTPYPSPDLEAARARDAARLLAARSLAEIVSAQARIAQDELAALDDQTAQLSSDQSQIVAQLAALQKASDERRANRDRLTRDAFRLAAPETVTRPLDLNALQLEAFDELTALERGLHAQQELLADRQAQLAQLGEAVAAKQAQLVRLSGRARYLASAAAAGDESYRAAQAAVLAALANEASAVELALAQLVASATPQTATDDVTWSLPVRGAITQPFGPSALPLEPPVSFRGVTYPHFHDAIDLAASLGAPVTAAADGQVTFVGHLPDGAMVVLIAHAGGIVSLYAHLDDTFVRPPVRVGQSVTRGQVVGFVGLTGITTGPHLHFGVRRDGVPVDPLSVLTRG